jgi:hypothetical protein
LRVLNSSKIAPEPANNIEADLLDRTIDTLSIVKLRQIFKKICKISPGARKQAVNLLLASQDAKLGPHDNENEQEYKDALSKDESAKQPVPRFAPCENCEKEFDVTTNSSTSCRYHTSEIPIASTFL